MDLNDARMKCETTFDPIEKIWSGEDNNNFALSYGEFYLNHLSKHPDDNVIQVCSMPFKYKLLII